MKQKTINIILALIFILQISNAKENTKEKNLLSVEGTSPDKDNNTLNNNAELNDIFGLDEDSEYLIKSIEELAKIRYEKNAISFNDTTVYTLNSEDIETPTTITFSDSIYIARLNALNSPIELTYNKIVRRYIEIYTGKIKSKSEIMLGLCNYYMPLFEEALEKENMPLELKYLPIIESALNPFAYSRAGASGLWQFMPRTGKMYGLEITSYVDQRRNPLRASEAGAKYLKDLYHIYKDWALAIAAYNCGPGNVNKAIARSGGKRNYWDIYYRLPRETRGYVPAFIAAAYLYNYYKEHAIIPKSVDLPLMIDTFYISQSIHFEQISETLKIPIEKLKELNPQYRRNVIPASSKKRPYELILPISYSYQFAENEKAIYAFNRSKYFKGNIVHEPQNYSSYSSYAGAKPKGKSKIYYTVKKGDNLGYISEWFNTRVSYLKSWNNTGTLIRAGNRLAIYVPRNQTEYYKKINSMSFPEKNALAGKSVKSNSSTSTSSYGYYKVRRGDNIWQIARKYPGVSGNDLMKINNLKSSNIHPGQVLKIKQ